MDVYTHPVLYEVLEDIFRDYCFFFVSSTFLRIVRLDNDRDSSRSVDFLIAVFCKALLRLLWARFTCEDSAAFVSNHLFARYLKLTAKQLTNCLYFEFYLPRATTSLCIWAEINSNKNFALYQCLISYWIKYTSAEQLRMLEKTPWSWTTVSPSKPIFLLCIKKKRAATIS